ncbi:hypothetical protein GCM10009801_10860 [Streptomyces albiaxialis]|uniref:O-antigen ligase-related domain-containing protein n=1 Tax=Streptomyces albiaxialis TaxID=329523 RepID=A0ABN2VLS8_9ACTN
MASPALGSPGSPPARGPRERDSTVPDVAGVLVLGCCAGWALLSATGRDARPEGVLLAVLAVGAGYACGRILGSLLPVGAPALTSLVGLTLTLASPDAVPGTASTMPPGRAGATAALLVLSVGAACCAAWAAPRGGLRRVLLLLLGALIASVGLAWESLIGFTAAMGVLLCALAAGRIRRRGPAFAGLLLAVALATGTTWAVAERALPAGLSSSLEGQLTEHRVELWEDALSTVRDHPLLGSGPDSFGETSETAGQQADTDGKPHSAPLQMGAEQGVPGVALLGAAFGWLLLALWRSPRPTAVVLTAGAALAALAAVSCVGNALSFTEVTTGAGMLAGFATAHRMSYRTPSHQHLAP